jgi:hypothetical protein
MTALRLVCVNGVYFKYPVTISLNDADFLMKLLIESRRADIGKVYTVRKDAIGFVFL